MPVKPPLDSQNPSDEAMLYQLQKETFDYFLHEANLENGLVRDKTKADWPASIAATGLGLASYPIGVERSFLTRDDAIKRTLATLRFFSHRAGCHRIPRFLLSLSRHAHGPPRLEVRTFYR